jgi:hypothetical protein
MYHARAQPVSSPMNIFDFLGFNSPPAAAAPSPQLHLHVTNQNATAGPFRLSPVTIKVQPLPFTAEDDDDDEDEVLVPVGEVDPRLTGGLPYEEVVSRQATALITLRKACKWVGCSRGLVSTEILERVSSSHAHGHPVHVH